MSALRTTETAKALYLLAYARGLSHKEAAAVAGASRRSFYDARVRDRDFGRACTAIYAVRLAEELDTRAELVGALRTASAELADAAERLEHSSGSWFGLRRGAIDFLEAFDSRLGARSGKVRSDAPLARVAGASVAL